MKSIIKTGAVLGSILLSISHSYSQSNDNHSNTTKQVMNTSQERTSNKDVIRNLYENILNERKFQLIDDLFSPNYKTNIAGGGIAAFKEQVSAIVKAIPDAHWEVLELIAEGNKVIVKQELHGTQTEQFRTFAPSGKKVANVGFGVYEFADGKIIESQVTTDRLGFLQEIGALPIDLSTLSQMNRDAVGPSLIDKFFVPKRGFLIIFSKKRNRIVRGLYKGFLQQARGKKMLKRLRPRFVKIKKFIFTRSRKVKGRRK